MLPTYYNSIVYNLGQTSVRNTIKDCLGRIMPISITIEIIWRWPGSREPSQHLRDSGVVLALTGFDPYLKNTT
jgi:hypothetical protein